MIRSGQSVFTLSFLNSVLRSRLNSECYFAYRLSSNISEMSDVQSNHQVKNAGDRKFYSLPDDYESTSKISATTESKTLLEEIYSNISSRKAKFVGPYGNRSVIYCDYAASGQSLNFIEDYIRNNIQPFYGNTHTTITATSLQSTYFRHEAKDIIRKAVNASEHDAVIFTGNGCTSAVNKLIQSLNFKFPVVVFIGPYEHHSNILPWREINAKVIRIGETLTGLIDIQHLEAELKKYYGKDYHLIGAFSAASNVTGILSDDITISVLLHKYGALSFWDYAAAGPYVKIDMNPVYMGEDEGLAYKDALFLSPHKFVGGPETPGILVAKKTLFSKSVPSEPGGGTVFFVTRTTHRYLKDIEMREEGGTPSIIGAIRAGMVFQLKEAVGVHVISEREKKIFKMVMDKWKTIPGLKVLGNTEVPRLPIFSFMIYHSKSGLYLHHNFVCALLNDMFGIQTRSGCACAGPYALDLLGIDESLAEKFDKIIAENSCLDRTHLRRKGEFSEREVLRPGFVRLTFPYFMSDQDIEFIVNSVSLVALHGWKELPQYSFNPETGEWKHKNHQNFVSRKWLGSISYRSGTFMIKEENEIFLNTVDVLEEAKMLFKKSIEAAMKKFTPDQNLIFDTESSVLRWFLLPCEAKQYLLGDITSKIKDPVFIIRNGKNSFASNNINEEDDINKDSSVIFINQSVISNKDENSNISDVDISSLDCKTPGDTKNGLIKDKQCCLLKRDSYIYSSLPNYSDVKCKWHSPPTRIFRPFLKAVEDFKMIKDGDKVLVCLSGGKDSLSLLHTLHQYIFYAKKKGIKFDLGAMTVDPKSPMYDPSPLKEYLKALRVPYFYEEQDIIGQAASLDKCTSICSFCSRMKRGRIYACAHRENYNVIALGQHLDDLTESFLMSVFHNGRLRTMKAHYVDKTSSLRIIRPFVYVREKDLRNFAEQKKLPVIPENCPACFEAPKERYRMKQLLASQEVKYPNLYRSLKNALFPLMAINATGVENKLLGKSSLKFSRENMEESDY